MLVSDQENVQVCPCVYYSTRKLHHSKMTGEVTVIREAENARFSGPTCTFYDWRIRHCDGLFAQFATYACHAIRAGSGVFIGVQEVPHCKAFGSCAFTTVR